MKDVAKNSNGVFNVGVVNCDEETVLCNHLDATSFPELRRYNVYGALPSPSANAP
jgi:hypothetical protein